MIERGPSSLAGRLADAVAGPVGSPAWIRSRWERFEGTGNDTFGTTPELDRLAAGFRAASPHFDKTAGRWKTARPLAVAPVPAVTRTGFLASVGDGLVNVPDYDDQTPFAPVESAPKVAAAIEAERLFAKLCEDETGVAVDPELKAKKDAEKAALREQSHAIAGKLEQAGITAYRSGEWSLWTYGIHSGDVAVIPQFRRCAFIPYIGAQIREPFVRSLEFWLQRFVWSRFWTLTGGPRVPLRVGDMEAGKPKVREAIKELSDRIRRLNDADFMHAAGVRIVFRSIELGTVEKTRQDVIDGLSGAIERDADGTLWFHPHAHCLVWLEKGRIEKSDWSAFLVKLRAHWGDWMDDGGVIRSVREAVKYVTKPAEIESLTPAETAELFAQLRRLKLCQPLGALADQIEAREEAGLTLLRERTDDGFVWREVPDWNKRGSSDEERHAFTVTVGEDSQGDAIELSGAISERDMARAAKLAPSDVDACVVVARCAPAASSLCLKEPRVVVMGKRWDEEKVKRHPLVQRLRLHTLAAWHAGLALIRVHTGTPTDGKREAQRALALLADVPERAAPPGLPVFAT